MDQDYQKETLQPQPPRDVPPQNVPPQYAPPRDVPPQNVPPQYAPPQYAPPQNVPPQYAPPQNVPPQYAPPQYAPPRDVPPQQEPQQEPVGWTQPETAPEGEPKKTKKKKKWLILAVCVTLLLAVGAVVAFLLLGGLADEPEAIEIRAYIDEEGTAYIPLMNGEVIEIDEREGVKDACLTPDREHIVVLLEDGTLYYTDGELENRERVTRDASYLLAVRNDGFCFKEKEQRGDFRYSFEEEEITETGGNMMYFAEGTTSCVYWKQGRSYLLPYDSTKVKLADGNVTVPFVSDDGTLAVWYDYDSGDGVHLYADGKTTTLGNFDPVVVSSKDQKLLVISYWGGGEIYLKQPDERVVTVELEDSHSLSVTGVFTKDGPLQYQNAADTDGIYVVGWDKLYYISLDGTRKTVLSGRNITGVFSEKVFYAEEEENGEWTNYFAELDGTSTENETELPDIHGFARFYPALSRGDYLYLRDNEKNYCYHIKEDEMKEIDTERFGYAQVSADGSAVYYLEDLEDIPERDGYRTGTLKRWDYETGESTVVAHDVLAGSLSSLSSGLEDGLIRDDGMVYVRYGYCVGSTPYGDLMYYDGDESTTLARDVRFDRY